MDSPVPRRIVVVLGMHRSGTSALTRGLASLGAQFGSHLMASSDSENPTGFWEDLDFYDLNNAMLSKLQSNWHGFRSVGEDDCRALGREGFALKAVELLRQRTHDCPLFALKDPRLARLLPFWKPLFPLASCDASFLVALRNPLAVARSLNRRNGLDPCHAYLLWASTMVAAMRGVVGERFTVVSYDRLLEDPHGQLERVAFFLDLQLEEKRAEEYIGSFLDAGLRHHVMSDAELQLDPNCPPLVREMYAFLSGLADQAKAFSDLAHLEAKITVWESELERMTAALALVDRLHSLSGSHREAAEALTARVHQELARSASLDLRLGELSELARRMGHEASVAASTIHELNQENVRRGAWALGLDAQLRDVQNTVAELRQSTSWRVTYPLRVARRLGSQAGKALLSHGTYFDIWAIPRRIYHGLPLRADTRGRVKSFVYGRFPALCSSLPSYRLWAAQQRSLARMTAATTADRTSGLGSQHNINAASVVLPVFRDPLVSVVVPCFGKVDYTLRCLASIQANPPSIPFEVIVVDDCSLDGSADILSECRGILLLRNAANLGFIRSCNRGAAIATGEFLCFLNNDTEIRAGWLEELYKTFFTFPRSGLVGSKLVYPDGSLQEAGGILWRDGSAWNFGRGQDPSHPQFNYARSVDYCSGASVMIRRALFRSFGGFDEHYLPAYAEDSDLALKVQAAGMSVIYQPLSVVVHHEGVTSGTDLAAGAKRYQVVNAQRLHERWERAFATRHLPGEAVDAAKDREILGRILVLDHCTPTPDQDAGSITALNFMLLLRQAGLQVTFAPEDNFLYSSDYTSALQRAGVEALYAPAVRSVREHLDEHADRYDMVLLFRPLVAERHLRLLRERCPRAKLIYHASDLHFLRLGREAEITGTGHEAAAQIRTKELAVMRAVDCVVVHSTVERDLLVPALPHVPVEVFQWAIPVPGTHANFGSRRDIAFIGGYQHGPNVDAVEYFVEAIFPRIRSRLPGVRFLAIGSKPPDSLFALAGEDVQITGFIDDLAPVLDGVRVAVAPLRIGAGIKGKIGTTLSVGLPCVATSVAAEGMNLCDGEEILIADDPDAFADTVVSLYENPALWQRLSERGICFAERNYGAAAAEEAIRRILGAVGFSLPEAPFAGTLASPVSRELSAASGGNGCVIQRAPLAPIAVIECAADFATVFGDEDFRHALDVSRAAEGTGRPMEFCVEGFCIPCGRTVPFMVDMQSGGHAKDGVCVPNWRERMECPLCRMNNRNRLVAALLEQSVDHLKAPASVYLMEQVTPIFKWSMERFPAHTLIGSEYLGDRYRSGDVVRGLRHEDAMALSFSDASVDIILSNDVLEHVPDPWLALQECFRVLRPSGTLLFTIPFDPAAAVSRPRARIESGEVLHILPPVYHGNPVSEEGSLVFTDFGCDLLDRLRGCGFSTVCAEFYLDPAYGHLGDPQIVFRAVREPVQAG